MTDKKAVLRELGWSDALVDAFLADAGWMLDGDQDFAAFTEVLTESSDVSADMSAPSLSSGHAIAVKV
jgi:hypothetical protein